MFLLYQKKDRAFPETIKIYDSLYKINADFRNILRIFDMLDDKNIPDYKKIEVLKLWFFEDGLLDLPDDISQEQEQEQEQKQEMTEMAERIVDGFVGFVDFNRMQTPVERRVRDAAPYGEPEPEAERQFCYNFDAEEIYAGFLCEYGIDLIYIDFLHWYKFKILLDNLSPESAFKKKIELRFMDLSGFRDNQRIFGELAKAKEAIQLPMRFTEIDTGTDLRETREFNEIWGKAGEGGKLNG